MAKNWKRALALFLVAVMVVTLFPNNLFGNKAKKVKAADGEAKTITFDAAVELANLEKSAAIADGTEYVEGFFKTFGSTKRANMNDFAIDIGKTASAGITFTVPSGYTANVTVTARGAGDGKTAGVTINDVTKEYDGKTIGDQTWEGLVAGAQTLASADPAGKTGGTRITKIVVELVPTLEPKTVTFDAAVELANLEKSAAITDGTEYVEGFFKTFGSTKRANMNDFAIDIGKTASAGITFTVPSGYTANVTVTARGAGDGKTAGVTINDVTKEYDGKTIGDQTWEGLVAGAQTLASADPAGKTGGTRITKIVVDLIPAGTVVTRTDWNDVVSPVIDSVTQDGNKVKVDFTMLIDKDGADSVSVEMKDADGNSKKIVKVTTKGTSGSAEFTPDATGTYTFVATAERADEVDADGNVLATFEAKASEAASIDYVLPLSNSLINVLYNKGNGTVGAEWSAVSEATGYQLTWTDGTSENSKVVEGTSADVDGLTVGTSYTFTVVAIRGEEVGPKSAERAITVTDEAQQKWGYIVYGNGANASNAALIGDLNADGKVTLRSGKVDEATGKLTGSGNNGKWVPASYDGINFYYTAVPTSLNFTLRAKVHVDQWSYSNAQEAFGLMANDQLGGSGWNNSYAVGATKTEYYWGDEIDEDGNVIGQGVTTDATATKVSHKLGIMAQEKKGLTNENLAKIEANDSETLKNCFSSTTYPLELRYTESESQDKNLIGNAVNKTSNENIVDMYLTIQKNNTGYFVTYESADGSYSQTKKYYDTEALSQLDSENVYVGFFTSRYAQITVSDVTFTTIDPKDDAPAEEKPIEKIVVNQKVTSPTATGTEEYVIKYLSNCDGLITVFDEEGAAIVTDKAVVANEVADLATVTLKVGKNNFTYTFDPADDYVPGEDQVMASYEPIEGKFSVSFRTYGAEGSSLYVAPGCSGTGSKEDPMNVYDALKYVRPGQTIVVMEGTYKLEKTIKVERGIDGTADSVIKMVVDPEAASRPVFDFQGLCAGMVLAGDYWYFQGFDVTNSADGQKGLQLSGNYCTLDNINAYHNGNTGIQISRYLGTDEYDQWPSNNLVLNCTSYGNADAGYEDADGFAAKLTVGDNNVFDGCIAYNNADDGWDLFAKVQSGSIGAVTIRNCVAYGNGYLEDGTNAGNGNGFKMGGDSMSGKHVLENCVAFNNKAKGIDSNSCPDNIVKNCTTFNNESYNVALYTNTAANTAYVANGIISYRNSSLESALAVGENLKGKGTQVETDYKNETDYYWNGADASVNTQGAAVAENWFVSTDTKFDPATKKFTSTVVTRNDDNTINMNGLLELTDAAPADAGARMAGTASLDNSVVPADVKNYKVIDGANQSIVAGDAKDLTIRIDADRDLYDHAELDDVAVDESNLIIESGSTIVTLKASYVKKLKAGEHTLRVFFTDGKYAETKIYVEPNTGDRSPLALYIALILLAGCGIAGTVIYTKKSKKA